MDNILDKFNFFVEFCFEHGGALRAHSIFSKMQNELRDDIKSLLSKNMEKCIWTKIVLEGEFDFYEHKVWATGCGKVTEFKANYRYCPACGKLIEVMDVPK